MTSGPARITARDNPLLVRVRRLLGDPAGYRRAGVVWLEGDHLLRAALARGVPLPQVLLPASREHDADLTALAQRAGRLALVADRLWRELSTLESPPPIGALIDAPAAPPIAARLPSIVLDRVQDAGNIGSLMRSAAAFGFEQVVALKGTAALWSPKVLRAGMGAHFALRLVEQAAEADLAGLGLPMLATSSHGGHSLPGATLPWPCAWVFGHEGQGVSAALQASCTATLRIPQPGGEESLNVAAAGAVCLYESARVRKAQ
jgi:TrmH family RNA methyltransferase